MEAFLGVFKSATFLEGLYLLVATAVLTGIIVPVVKYGMDKRNFEQQKKFEADLARQSELVKARAQFLRDLADPVWQFQLLAPQISYDALQISYDARSKEKYEAALAKYDRQSWEHLKKIRAIVGGARWFTSDAAYRALIGFVDGWLIDELHITLTTYRRHHESGGRPDVSAGASRRPQSWMEFNEWLHIQSRDRTDSLLVTLAKDFDLAPSTIASGQVTSMARTRTPRGP